MIFYFYRRITDLAKSWLYNIT